MRVQNPGRPRGTSARQLFGIPHPALEQALRYRGWPPSLQALPPGELQSSYAYACACVRRLPLLAFLSVPFPESLRVSVLLRLRASQQPPPRTERLGVRVLRIGRSATKGESRTARFLSTLNYDQTQSLEGMFANRTTDPLPLEWVYVHRSRVCSGRFVSVRASGRKFWRTTS